jgi:hypothetical protein
MTKNISILSIFGVIALIVVGYNAQKMDLNLQDSSVLTGYTLIAVMLCVALLNTRKKLSMIPLGKASSWLVFHVVGGLVCLGLFWIHTENFWPKGLYEGFLAGTFYLVSLSGIFGYLIQRLNSRKLTETGIEVIYERIPLELREIQEKAEEQILECTEKTGSDVLANHYLDTMVWYFQKPRFYWSTLFGAGNAKVWLRTKGGSVKRYLSSEELEYFEQIENLAELKILVDTHFVHQNLNKKWLLLHVPLSVGLVVMALWHILLVEVYAL